MGRAASRAPSELIDKRLPFSRTEPASLSLDLFTGPQYAEQVIDTLVCDLITSDLFPEPVAYRLVCEGSLAGEPWLLAEARQM